MFVFAQQPSLANQYIAELRDVSIQQDRMRFRRNLERLGELMAYEISKTLLYQTRRCTNTSWVLPTRKFFVNSLFWLPLCGQGYHFIRDLSTTSIRQRMPLPVLIGGIAADGDDEFEIAMDYIVSPDLSGRTLILCDPMLATGRSLEKVYHALLRYGIPAQTHIAAVIASPEGVRMYSNNCHNAICGLVPLTITSTSIRTLFPVWVTQVICLTVEKYRIN